MGDEWINNSIQKVFPGIKEEEKKVILQFRTVQLVKVVVSRQATHGMWHSMSPFWNTY
jgi:rhamnogalacturonyl hydrolase YesR